MRILVLFLILVLPFTIKAQQSLPTPTPTPTPTGSISDWELSFGLGVEQYKNTYIDSASLRGDNRIVTTEKTFDTRPSAWLTVNWNVWGWNTQEVTINGVKTKIDDRDIRYGFFAGVKLIDGNSDAFSSFALGPQISFLVDDREISVGLGWVTHPVKEYAYGIIAGQSLPEQYDDIVFSESTENSYMLMMSMSF